MPGSVIPAASLAIPDYSSLMERYGTYHRLIRGAATDRAGFRLDSRLDARMRMGPVGPRHSVLAAVLLIAPTLATCGILEPQGEKWRCESKSRNE